MKILLVDDNQAGSSALAQYLQLHGHSVTLANNGAEALAALGQTTYDVMISDIVMPVMSGTELINRANESHVLPPTIVLSGGDLWYAKLPGVIEALAKPADPAEIERAAVKAAEGAV